MMTTMRRECQEGDPSRYEHQERAPGRDPRTGPQDGARARCTYRIGAHADGAPARPAVALARARAPARQGHDLTET